MREMRLCLASVGSRVGDFDRNLDTIKRVSTEAASKDADLVCLRELSLSG